MKPRLSVGPLRPPLPFTAAGLAVIFLAFAIRVYHLDAVGFDYDESFGTQAAVSGLPYILHVTAINEPHPPLFYAFLGVWLHVVGTSEYALRVPSLIANVLTIALLIKIADLFSWRSAGLAGALLLALNPYQLWYSQEARMYAPLALFGLLAIYCFLQSLHYERPRYLAFYALFMLLALYSHYYAIFLAVFVSLLWLVGLWYAGKPRPAFVRWLAVQTFVAGLYLPWLVYADRIATSFIALGSNDIDLIAIVKEAPLRYGLGNSVPTEIGYQLSLGFVAVIVAGLWFAGRKRGTAGYPPWFRYAFTSGYLLAPMAIGFLVSIAKPMFAARYFMISAPAFYLVLGLGLAGLYRRSPFLGVPAALFLLSAQGFSLYNYYYDNRYIKTDFPEAATYIERHVRPGDAIVLDGWTQTQQFWYYHTLRAREPVPSYLFPLAEPGKQLNIDKLDEIMSKHHGVWMLDYDVFTWDPEQWVESHLAREYYQVVTRRAGWNRVVYYASAPPTAPQIVPLDVSFDGEAMLKDFTIQTTSVRPGEVLPMALRWQAIKDVDRSYAVSWRLLDQDGRIVSQRDAEPASGFARSREWKAGEEVMDRYGMLIPAWLPPGRYSVVAVVYDRTSRATFQPRQGGRDLKGSAVPLAGLEVLDVPPVAAIDGPSPSHKSSFTFGGLKLLGYDLDNTSLRVGDTATLKLYWEAVDDVAQDYEVATRLMNEKGEVRQERVAALGPPWFPASRWQRGRTVVTYLDVKIPAREPSGAYRLSLTLQAAGLAARTFTDFPRLSLAARERTFSEPPIAYSSPRRKQAGFGESIELLGYDMQPAPGETLAAGEKVHLTVYWQALKEMEKSYKVFVHLVGPDNQIYGQADAIPLGGAAPTESWMPGEVLADSYDLMVRPGAPAGAYRLIVGFYEPENGSRLPMDDGSGDNLSLASLVVSAAVSQ